MTNEALAVQLARLRGGELDALEVIYRELQRPVLTVIFRMVQNQELAEDLTQEVFVKLWQSPPGEEVASPRAWFFRMAHNLALDALRRKNPVPLPEELPDAGFEEAAQTRLDLEAALASLEVRERALVTLHLYVGLRFREIAQTMDLPLGTVLWRYSRALGRLRAELDGGAR